MDSNASYTSATPIGMQGNNICSELAEIFFSNENLDLIQKKLVLEVFKQTNCRIPFQSNDQLLIIMRSIYGTHAKNHPCEYAKQVKELDDAVVASILPDVVSSIQLNIAHKKSVLGQDRPLLDLPLNVTKRSSLSGDRGSVYFSTS